MVDDWDRLFGVDEYRLEAGHDVGLDLLTVDEEQVGAIAVVLIILGIFPFLIEKNERNVINDQINKRNVSDMTLLLLLKEKNQRNGAMQLTITE